MNIPTVPHAYTVVKKGTSWEYQPTSLLQSEATLVTAPKQVVTYKINPQAKWSDGTPITSHDFKYTWDQIVHGNDIADTTGYANIDSVDDSNPAQAVATFSAPYGDWRLRGQARSNVAADLNQSSLASSHVGPIGWDVDAGDVGFYRDGRPAEECARAYLEAIERGLFSKLPGGIYNLSYIRQYARAIDCDEARLLDYYRRSADPDIRHRAHILLLLAAGHPWATIGAVLFCSFSTIERSVPASNTASAPSRRIRVCESSRSRSMPVGVERS